MTSKPKTKVAIIGSGSSAGYRGSTVSQTQKQNLIAAATSFRGDSTIGGFRGNDGDGVRAIARRYGVVQKRGQFAIPAVRLVVGDLVEGRSFTIERAPATGFVLDPSKR